MILNLNFYLERDIFLEQMVQKLELKNSHLLGENPPATYLDVGHSHRTTVNPNTSPCCLFHITCKTTTTCCYPETIFSL